MRLIDHVVPTSPAAGRLPMKNGELNEAVGAFADFLNERDPAARRPAPDGPRGRTHANALPEQGEAMRDRDEATALAEVDLSEIEDVAPTLSELGLDARPVRDVLDTEPSAGEKAPAWTRDIVVEPAPRARIDWLALRPAREMTMDGEGDAPADLVQNAAELTQGPDRPLALPEARDDGEARAVDDRLAAMVPRRDDRAGDRASRTSMRDSATATPRETQPQPTQLSAPPAPEERPSISVQTAAAERAREGQGRDPQAAVGLLPARPTGDQPAPDQPLRPVTPVSVQAVPAPPLDLQSPAQTVTGAIREESAIMARSAAVDPFPASSEPMRILKIQLHPLELGVVTARLSMKGGEMSVELQAETREATARLQADSEEIAKTLRGLGIEIERVTVTQQAFTNTQSQNHQGHQGAFERSGERLADDGAAGGRQGGRNGPDANAGGLTGERDAGDSQPGRGVYI